MSSGPDDEVSAPAGSGQPQETDKDKAAPKGEPRRTQAQRTAESDRRLLRAALKLIGQRGYKATSLAAIGEEAGYSRGLVNERFGSKAGLLWALVQNMLRHWNDDNLARSGTGHIGIDALNDLLDNHRRALELDDGIRALYALMFEALGPVPELGPEFQELHRAFRSDVKSILDGGIAAGVIRADLDAHAQAVILIGSLRGMAFQYFLDRDAFPLRPAYEELKRNLRRTLAP